eukprot:TRINITY_DN3359_c0_g1_i2.p1 TRINITY_DN3359_c0_g1~~TRINITY_DN3359_c0_g1_i2.p1  ORF type:complete len:523 (-),score=132.99 TRINITY_DN3359_c0_g1_i2:80-1648(-)
MVPVGKGVLYRWRKPFVVFNGCLGSFLGACWYAEMEPDLMVTHIIRFTRTALYAVGIIYDYKKSFWHLSKTDPLYPSTQKEVNLRTANHLLALCLKNKGIYVKAGQQIASMNHVLPKQFTDTLAVLQDKAEPTPFAKIEKTILREYGKPSQEIFQEIDKEPIAAASLAQVHHAYLKDGRECAVKIQYPDMKNMFKADLFTIGWMVKLIAWSFPNFEFTWILPEFKKALEMELDFKHEAQNAKRIAELFKQNKQIKIPEIYWEYIHACKINDTSCLDQNNINKHEAAALLMNCFSEQIFVHGFVHSDPHPGNLMVRKVDDKGKVIENAGEKKGLVQLVLLDHGLYKEIPEKMRIWYCKLWRGLVLRNNDDIEKYGRKLGCGDHSHLFALLLTFRPPTNKDIGLDQSLSEKDRKAIRAMFSSFEDALKLVTKLMKDLPSEMLFILRTKNLLRSINKELESNVNRFAIMARTSLAGIYKKGSQDSWWKKVRTWKIQIEFEAKLRFALFLRYLIQNWWVPFLSYIQ